LSRRKILVGRNPGGPKSWWAEILVGLGTAAAGLPIVQMTTAAGDAPTVPPAANAESDADLADDHFVPDSGRHFGSQVVHCGEMSGYNVTPIS